MTFTRKEEFATKKRVVLALSAEAGVAFEGTRNHIGAISSDICLSVELVLEGTRRHRQCVLGATSNTKRSNAFVAGAPIDAAAVGATLEKLVNFLERHADMSEGVAINLDVVLTREAEGRYVVGIISADYGLAGCGCGYC